MRIASSTMSMAANSRFTGTLILNLPVNATGADQYGRPLYGALRQVGSLVAAVPGSNRRFGEFDAVNAIDGGHQPYLIAPAAQPSDSKEAMKVSQRRSAL